MCYPRSKRRNCKGEDLITNLPIEIKQKILIHLPAKQAIKTSLLSSKWRYTWTSVPELVLRDEDFYKRCIKSAELHQFETFGDNFLSLHDGSIHKFKVSSKLDFSGVLERWLLALSAKTGIQELELKLRNSGRFYMPSSFFEFHALNRLVLHGCVITWPQKFEGFKFLNHLKFNNCVITETDIQNLVQNSPLLKHLSLKNCISISSLKIFSPNLEKLRIKGAALTNLKLETPNLQCLTILDSSSEGIQNCSVNKSLACFKHIKELEIDCDYLQRMADSLISGTNTSIFDNLHKISFIMDFKSEETILDFRLLRSAPHLQTLHIWVRYFCTPDETVLELIRTENLSFENLHTIVIHGSVESESVLSFLRFLLIKSPVLKTVLLWKNDPLILQKLIQSEKASTDAQLVVRKISCWSPCSSVNPNFPCL